MILFVRGFSLMAEVSNLCIQTFSPYVRQLVSALIVRFSDA